ncbi:MAG: DAK2 domain-containing protein [Coriobacteriales bacterium]|nr:DAK2 domain-containing protein [Coriobacteriales bacterium]
MTTATQDMGIKDFRRFIQIAALALSERKDEINRLNVFPVPDGDTGTNMSLTLDAVVAEVMALPDMATLADMRKAITHGSLMGARGNSGVITSQILRGLCDGLDGATEFNCATIARACAQATETAFNAIRKPVEGTILTVLRDVSDAAQIAYESGLSTNDVLHRLSEEAFASVRRTPELLPVLKENGVVDAGGFGLAILIDAFAGAVTGTSKIVPDAASFTRALPKVAIEQINDWEGSNYLYCTEFLLKSDTINQQETLDFLGTMGDCELMVGSTPDFKVHVHTNEPGTVLTYMTERGQVFEVHIHNMRLQSEQREQEIADDGNTVAGLGSLANGSAKNQASSCPCKPYGFVAVCSGTGTAKILESQGVDLVVRGGQTMNPATKDFVDAINKVNAECVFIFPNNKNVILAANAAAEIITDEADIKDINVEKNVSAGKSSAAANKTRSSNNNDQPKDTTLRAKKVVVIPTKSVLQSFSAMFAFNEEDVLDANVEAMNDAIAQVRYAEVTTAIKDAKTAKGERISAGDVIGLVNGDIEVVGSTIADVAMGVVEHIAVDADVLTLLAGQELADDEFEDLQARIEDVWPELEIDAQRGEQPLYPLVLAAE